MPNCPICFDYIPEGEQRCESCGYIIEEFTNPEYNTPNVYHKSEYAKYKTDLSDTDIYFLFSGKQKPKEDEETKKDEKISYIMSENSYIMCKQCRVSIEFAFITKTVKESYIDETWKCVKCGHLLHVKKQLTER